MRPLGEVFRDHGESALDSLRRLLAAPLGAFLTILVIAIALLLPSLLQQLAGNLYRLADNFQESATITLFLESSLPDRSGLELSDDLLTRPDIDTVAYLSKDDALRDFRTYSGFDDVLDGLEENPLPASITVKPISHEPVEIERLAADLQELAGVDSLRVDLDWVQRLAALRNLIVRLNLVFTLVLALGVVLIIGNTIRLSIENRAREIEVIRLVGGTASFIARPFLYTGLLLGFAGGLLAGVILLGLQHAVQGQIDNLLSLYGSSFEIHYRGFVNLALVSLTGGALGLLGAGLSIAVRIYSSPP